MARGTTFAYRDAPHDPRRIGEELGVGYVVEGSLEGDGGRLLANVALVDAASGRQVWSERYDRPLEDLFAVQDKLVLRIATSLGGAVYRDRLSSAVRKRPGNLEIVRSLPARRRGTGQVHTGGERPGDRAAPAGDRARSDRLRRILGTPPGSTASRSTMAGRPTNAAAMARWLDAASQAVKLDPTNAWAQILCWRSATSTPTRCAAGGPRGSGLRTWRRVTSSDGS